MRLVEERPALREITRVHRMNVEMWIADFEFTPASAVEPILSAIPGVEHVAVESGSGRTSITFRSDDLTLATIVDAIGKAGYYTLIESVSSA